MSEFAQTSPFLTFFIVVAVIAATKVIIARTYRCIMVLVRGWPPPHLDADGDWPPRDEGGA